MEYIKLGASLYLPSTREDLIEIIVENKYPYLRSIILDTEDSVSAESVENCYENIKTLLNIISEKNKRKDLLVFIRPRNPEEFKKITSFENIRNIDGFVFPKFSVINMKQYLDELPSNMWYMPILENNIFTETDIITVRNFILQHKQNLLTVRIGMTDILNILKTRRNGRQTIYDISTASHIISQIVFAFAPFNINISGTVFEGFGEESIEFLKQEVEKDLLNGMFGKSAIHPKQVQIINDMYKVSPGEYETAVKLLQTDSPAVFKLHNAMQERSTHAEWAKKITVRKEIYGLA